MTSYVLKFFTKNYLTNSETHLETYPPELKLSSQNKIPFYITHTHIYIITDKLLTLNNIHNYLLIAIIC